MWYLHNLPSGIRLFNSVGFGILFVAIWHMWLGFELISFMGSGIEVIFSKGSGINMWYNSPPPFSAVVMASHNWKWCCSRNLIKLLNGTGCGLSWLLVHKTVRLVVAMVTGHTTIVCNRPYSDGIRQYNRWWSYNSGNLNDLTQLIYNECTRASWW